MKQLLKTIMLIAIVSIISSCANKNNENNNQVKKKILPVKVIKLQPKTFKHFFDVKANVEAVKHAIISPEMPGQIIKIFVSEGQNVNEGQMLLKLNSSVIESQIQGVKAQLNLAGITYEKQKKLWLDKKVGSEIQYLQAKTQYESLQEQLKTLQAQLDRTEIKAPFTGIVDRINLKEGELANPGMQVIEMVNLNEMRLVADVSERYLPVVNKGDTVEITFDTYKKLKLKRPIHRISNIINPANRTFEISVRTKNINNKLKPNMIANIRINDYTLDSAIIAPSIVIKKDFEKQFVFIVQKNDSNIIAKKVFVETGRSYNGKTVITKGLKQGDKLIIAGYNTVSNGSPVYIKN
jgi:RND family efflux transporter MFP subunit